MKIKAPVLNFDNYIANCIKEKKPNSIIKYFPNVDMRLGHIGLASFCKKNGVEIQNLRAGEFIVFTNSAFNRIKIFAAGNTIAYQKSWNNRKIPVRLIGLLPKFFNGASLNFDAAMKEAVELAYRAKRD